MTLCTDHNADPNATATDAPRRSLKLACPYLGDLDALPTSPETAHYTFDYPFGARLRCIRREWVERAEKGQYAGQYRYVTQTTSKTFNVAYTDAIKAEDPQRILLKRQELFRGIYGNAWNKPKASTYGDLIVLALGHLDDGREAVKPIHFRIYAGPEAFDAARALLPKSLPAPIWERLRTIEKISRRLNADSWAKHDAAHGGRCFDAVVMFREEYEATHLDFRAADGEPPKVLRLGLEGATESVPVRLVD